jgi:sugar phosphate isomerase/epimerase
MMLPDSTFEEDLETCRRAGVAGIGIMEDKLGSGRDEELAAMLRESGLRATDCGTGSPSILPTSWFDGPDDPVERIAGLIASIRRFEPFEPSQFIVLTGGDDALDSAEQRRLVVDGFRQIATAATEIGAIIGIEPMRAGAVESIVNTVAEAAELVAEIDHPGIGIIYDIWHHWDSPTAIEDIGSYASLFSMVHIGDWPTRPNGVDRAIPGEGVIDLAAIFDALEGAGYSGWYDLELVASPEFEDSILKIDRDEMLSRAVRGSEAAWPKARR